ncbi:MAG: outer membrane lipoprotein-sorting protein [Oligoflexales bacterium]
MNAKIMFSFALVSIVTARAAVAAEPDGLKIVQEADSRNNGFVDSVGEASMILKKGGKAVNTYYFTTKVLEGKNSDDKTLVVFDKPKDVKGTSLLTYTYEGKDNEQWIYLPATARVKRIASSNQSAPFVGSEFSYEDMVPMVVDKYTYKYTGMTKCGDGQKCFVVERFPKDADSGYKKVVLHIDNSQYRLHKAVLFDKSNKHVKTLTLQNFKQYSGKFWRAHSQVMENIKTGKSTEIQWQSFKFKAGLREGDFDQSALNRMR